MHSTDTSITNIKVILHSPSSVVYFIVLIFELSKRLYLYDLLCNDFPVFKVIVNLKGFIVIDSELEIIVKNTNYSPCFNH